MEQRHPHPVVNYRRRLDASVPEHAQAVGCRSHILCVDDDLDTCEILARVLGPGGYDVTTACSFKDGLVLAAAGGFAVIVLDNWLREASGVDLCRAIRRFDGTTPVLFYSAAAYGKDLETALSAGAQGYFIKPLGIDKLHQRIDQLTAEGAYRIRD